jgi:hypothetical protein
MITKSLDGDEKHRLDHSEYCLASPNWQFLAEFPPSDPMWEGREYTYISDDYYIGQSRFENFGLELRAGFVAKTFDLRSDHTA